MQIYFENSTLVSSGQDQDRLFIRFLKPEMFIDQSTGKQIGSGFIGSFIKKQMPVTPVSENMFNLYIVAVRLFSLSMLLLLALNYGPLGKKHRLTECVAPMQIMVFQALVMFPLPANVMTLYSKTKELVCFDIVPFYNSFVQAIFEFDFYNQVKLRENI